MVVRRSTIRRRSCSLSRRRGIRWIRMPMSKELPIFLCEAEYWNVDDPKHRFYVFTILMFGITFLQFDEFSSLQIFLRWIYLPTNLLSINYHSRFDVFAVRWNVESSLCYWSQPKVIDCTQHGYDHLLSAPPADVSGSIHRQKSSFFDSFCSKVGNLPLFLTDLHYSSTQAFEWYA